MPEAVLETPPAAESLGWRAGLPDELKQNEALVPFKTVGDLGKDYLAVRTKATELEKKIGEYVPKLPDDATDEDRNLYYDALGRPKQPSEYEFDGEDKNAPEWTNQWKQEFHSLGLTKTQAKALSQKWNGYMQKMVEAHNTSVQNEMKSAEAKLRIEMGDKYDTNVELAKRMHQKHLGTEFDKAFDAAPPEARFGMVKLLLKVAALTGEDRSPQAGNGLPGGKAVSFISYDKSPAPPKKG
jgi:hypothetical protein